MKKDKIYLVVIQSGGTYEASEYTEFATKDKTYAEKWANKYNKILDRWRPYFENLMENHNEFILNSDWAFYRWEILYNLDGAIVRKTELR